MQELDDKKWRHFSLDGRQEEDLVPVYTDEIVVWGLQDRGHIFCSGSTAFSLASKK